MKEMVASLNMHQVLLIMQLAGETHKALTMRRMLYMHELVPETS